jgi:hypothetical protein
LRTLLIIEILLYSVRSTAIGGEIGSAAEAETRGNSAGEDEASLHLPWMRMMDTTKKRRTKNHLDHV